MPIANTIDKAESSRERCRWPQSGVQFHPAVLKALRLAAIDSEQDMKDLLHDILVPALRKRGWLTNFDDAA